MASASPARRVAHKVLMRVFEEDAYADRAFASEAKDLDARDRAFAQRIAYGAIQMVRTLDHAIERKARQPLRMRLASDLPAEHSPHEREGERGQRQRCGDLLRSGIGVCVGPAQRHPVPVERLVGPVLDE